jgi:hypothetical protein
MICFLTGAMPVVAWIQLSRTSSRVSAIMAQLELFSRIFLSMFAENSPGIICSPCGDTTVRMGCSNDHVIRMSLYQACYQFFTGVEFECVDLVKF